MKLKEKIKFFLIRKLSKLLIYSTVLTCKKKIKGEEKYKKIKKSNIPVIIIFWHRHIFYCIYNFKNSGVQPLISFSPDGEIVSQIAEEFGMDPVRGSSSKGGAKAFLQILRSIKDNNSEILITADGPRGPLREIKDGTVVLAKKTGAAVIPVSWYSSKVKIFEKSWDKFMVPKPFSKILFAYGDPIYVPGNIEKSELKEFKKIMKESLDILEHDIIKEIENNEVK